MPQTPHQDLLDALDESPELRSVVARVATLDSERREAFVRLLRSDTGLNLETRLWVLRIARNEPFLASARARFGADRSSLHSPFAGAISSVG